MKDEIICKAVGAFGVQLLVTNEQVRFRKPSNKFVDWVYQLDDSRDEIVPFAEIAAVAHMPGEGNYGGYIHLIKHGDQDKGLPRIALEATSLERCLCFTSDKNREFKIVRDEIEKRLTGQT